MKKIFLYGIFAMLLLQACEKNTLLIEDKLPEVRVAETLESYRSTLTQSPNGWIAYLYTSQVGGGYNFYMDFKPNDRVLMLADFDEDTAEEIFESTYRLKQVMAPSLIFDTYNYLHLLSDPDPNSFGGITGSGYGSDFEFEFREQVGDTIKLIGKKRQTNLILIKATVAEKTLYTTGGGFKNILGSINTFLNTNRYLYIEDPEDPSKRVQITINTDVKGREVSLIWVDVASIKSTNQIFSFSPTGLQLKSALNYKTVSIKSIYLDNATGKLMAKLANDSTIEIKRATTPILPLHLLIGTAFSRIIVPNATTYPGWSPDFITRLTAASNGVRTFSVGGQQLNLINMAYVFNTTTNILTVNVTTRYGTSNLPLAYQYSYTKTADGIFKFTFVAALNTNSTTLRASFNPIFEQRLNVDQFTLDYFTDPITGASLAQFKSIENPNYTFTGEIQ